MSERTPTPTHLKLEAEKFNDPTPVLVKQFDESIPALLEEYRRIGETVNETADHEKIHHDLRQADEKFESSETTYKILSVRLVKHGDRGRPSLHWLEEAEESLTDVRTEQDTWKTLNKRTLAEIAAYKEKRPFDPVLYIQRQWLSRQLKNDMADARESLRQRRPPSSERGRAIDPAGSGRPNEGSRGSRESSSRRRR
ncbi:MAG: hypothetical protein M1828_002466 [Chrysothrix sp. TS-e1954]|nr:MAG: hypothetical protein M1828_002466 [Chrysothrix sp. TS-e1954]